MKDYVQEPNLFKGLSDSQLENIIGSGFHRNLKPKSVLFHQGDPANRIYMVKRGRLKLSMLNEQGGEVIIRFINSGETTAAVASLKDKDYPVTAETVGETEVTGWDKATILGLMSDYPAIAINLLNTVLERINEVQQRYLELSTERVEQRIARSLLRLMQSTGLKKPEGILINFPLSREDIAKLSGTTLYTVSRTLSKWGKIGWIKSGRERITITDPHALVLFSENV